MKSIILGIAAAALGISAAQSQPSQAQQSQAQLNQTSVELWRLDCGDFVMKRYHAWFSDTFQYPPGEKALVSSCYLIRHGNRYLLWDTGVRETTIAEPVDNAEQSMTLKLSVVDQLAQIGVKPEQIEFVGISHYHGDHTGQAAKFPDAKLVIGERDWTALLTSEHPGLADSKSDLAHWLGGNGTVVPAPSDIDFFRDGRVVMLAMPGHTPGHSALLVRLESGPVLLSGDQYHFTEQVANRGVPPFNTSRAETLASHDRFDSIAANLKAKVIIQHEPADVGKLPAFPESAK